MRQHVIHTHAVIRAHTHTKTDTDGHKHRQRIYRIYGIELFMGMGIKKHLYGNGYNFNRNRNIDRYMRQNILDVTKCILSWVQSISQEMPVLQSPDTGRHRVGDPIFVSVFDLSQLDALSDLNVPFINMRVLSSES